MKQISFWMDSNKVKYIAKYADSDYFILERADKLVNDDICNVTISYNPEAINAILLDIFHAGTIYGIDFTFKKNLKQNATITQNSKRTKSTKESV